MPRVANSRPMVRVAACWLFGVVACSATHTPTTAQDAGAPPPGCQDMLSVDGLPVAPHVLLAQDAPPLDCHPAAGDYALQEDRSYLGPNAVQGTLPGSLRQRLRFSPDGTWRLTNQDVDGGPSQVFAGFWTSDGTTLTVEHTCPMAQRELLSCGFTDAGFLLGDPLSRIRHVYAHGPAAP